MTVQTIYVYEGPRVYRISVDSHIISVHTHPLTHTTSIIMSFKQQEYNFIWP